MKEKKKMILPLVSPIYTTTHGQCFVTSILHSNPSLRNWYLNNVMVLSVSNKNSDGLFVPRVDICQSNIGDNPYIEQQHILLTFLNGTVSRVIRNMIDRGYYVYFGAIDDFYMRGKDGFHKIHFLHDGLIIGYDQNEKTYSVYAYNYEMKLKVFNMPQICFERARKSTEKMGFCGFINAIKPMPINVELNPQLIKTRLYEYLDPPVINNSIENSTVAYGIITHQYIKKFLDLLYNNDSNMICFDLKPFKMIFEHKQFMLERIIKIEEYFKINDKISSKYSLIANKAKLFWDLCLYYNITYDKNKLKKMSNLIDDIDSMEKKLLNQLLSIMD